MRVHSGQPNIFITGGKDRDLTLWDVHNRETSSAEPSTVFVPVWKAKNVT